MMDSPDILTQKNVALTAALSSPSGEMNSALTQLINSQSVPSSPISPVIPLPTPHPTSEEQNHLITPKPSSYMSPETFLAFSQAYDLFHTPSPKREEDSAGTTQAPAKSAAKPVIELDLSSPQDPHMNSPITLKQEKTNQAEIGSCSVSSLLDRDSSQCNRQPTIPSSFSEFEVYTQQKSNSAMQIPASQISLLTASPDLVSSPDIRSRNKLSNSTGQPEDSSSKAETVGSPSPLSSQVADQTKTITPIFDLSRPITGQCLKQADPDFSEKLSEMQISDQVPMEIPCKTQTPRQGDFTYLGMEFETVPSERVSSDDVTSNSSSPLINQNLDWSESDFKFVKTESQRDGFNCSQLEISFSQLDKRFGGPQIVSSQSESQSQGTSPGRCPSQQSLRARGYRSKARITKNIRERGLKIDEIAKTVKWCKNKIKLCKSMTVYHKIDECRTNIRQRLMSCSGLMGSIKIQNRQDHDRAEAHCGVTPKLYPVLMSDLEKELGILTQLYLKYRNVVLSLRDLYQKENLPEKKPNVTKENLGDPATMSEIPKCSSKRSQSNSKARRDNKGRGNSGTTANNAKAQSREKKKGDVVEKRKPYKRETLCVVQGSEISERPQTQKHATELQITQHAQQAAQSTSQVQFRAIVPKSAVPVKFQKYQTILTPTAKNSNSPKRSPKIPNVQTEKEKRDSKKLVEEFFREQKIKIERGEFTLSQPLLQSKLSGNSPTLPARVRQLRGDIPSPSSPKRSPKRSSTPSKSPSTPHKSPPAPGPMSPRTPCPYNSCSSTQLDTQYLSQEGKVQDVGTCTPPEGGAGGRSSLLNSATMLPCYPYPSPSVKEIRIKNVKHKTSEQLVTRVQAHKALENLQTIHVSPNIRKDPSKNASFHPDSSEIAEKVLEQNNQTSSSVGSSSPVPLLPLPSEENSTVDNIVKFLIQQKKIGLGYNVIYTVLNKEKIYGSLDEDGLTVSGDVIYKSCGQWIRSLHKLPSLSMDSLRMAFSTDSDKSLYSEIEEYWETERAVDFTQEKSQADVPHPDRNGDSSLESGGFHVQRDGLEFFDIISLLEKNIEMRMVEIEEYVPCDVLKLPPHFWLVESAGVPSSIIEDIDSWPDN